MAKKDGVKVYTDVTKKDVKATKKQLLKELALAGTAGMKRTLAAADREGAAGYADEWDRYDKGATLDTPEATAAAIDEERAKMMGGLEVARDRAGRLHSKAMDRMAARNIAYQDSMKHAGRLSSQALRQQIEAMKLAAAGGGGGGGRGGGGGGGGYQPAITGQDLSGDPQADRLFDIYATGVAGMAEQGSTELVDRLSGAAFDRNPKAVLQADDIFQAGLDEGVPVNEMTNATYQRLRSQGVSYMDAMAIAQTLGARHGGKVSPERVLETGGGPLQTVREVVPGVDALANFAAKFRGSDTPRGTAGRSRVTREPLADSRRPIALDFSRNARTGTGPR